MNKNKYYFSLGDDKIMKEIVSNYYERGEKIVNIVMEPYKSKVVIEEILCANKGDKILLLTNGIEYFKKSSNVSIKPLNYWNKDKKKYDHLIIDDLSSYSEYGKLDFIELVDSFYKSIDKISIFSIEEVFSNCISLYITTQGRDEHFVEPRIVVSKLNLKKKIPNVITDYFEYFNRKKENVIIYVGENEKEIFYDNLNKYIFMFDQIKIYKDVNNYEMVELILNSGNQIIIVENIDKVIDKVKNVNFIIYSASKDFFTHKKIVFICGRVTALKEDREVLIVSKKESYAIDKAKGISRSFNKIVWE